MNIHICRIQDFDSESVFVILLTHSLKEYVWGYTSLNSSCWVFLKRNSFIRRRVKSIMNFKHVSASLSLNLNDFASISLWFALNWVIYSSSNWVISSSLYRVLNIFVSNISFVFWRIQLSCVIFFFCIFKLSQ